MRGKNVKNVNSPIIYLGFLPGNNQDPKGREGGSLEPHSPEFFALEPRPYLPGSLKQMVWSPRAQKN